MFLENFQFFLECFKGCLMGHTSRNVEDSEAECDFMNCGGLVQDEKKEENFNMLTRDYPCDIWVKKVARFCPCAKHLPKTKMKSFRLIPLTEKNL